MRVLKYEDAVGNIIAIEPSNIEDLVRLTIITAQVGDASAVIRVEDAPMVALAIMENAHVDHEALTPAGRALRALRKHSEVQEREQAEREAEDAEVRRFEDTIYGSGFVPSSEPVNDFRRKRYRAAREFFVQSQALAGKDVR